MNSIRQWMKIAESLTNENSNQSFLFRDAESLFTVSKQNKTLHITLGNKAPREMRNYVGKGGITVEDGGKTTLVYGGIDFTNFISIDRSVSPVFHFLDFEFPVDLFVVGFEADLDRGYARFDPDEIIDDPEIRDPIADHIEAMADYDYENYGDVDVDEAVHDLISSIEVDDDAIEDCIQEVLSFIRTNIGTTYDEIYRHVDTPSHRLLDIE